MRRRSPFHPALAAALAAAGMLAIAAPAEAQFDTRAPYALLVDVETDTVLFEKQADAPMPPASMAKLMTLEVVFEALERGELALEDEFMVSENAWRRGGASSGGSTMFAKVNSAVSISDLIHGVIIQSGNDACIVLAEGMAGTEAVFADVMNQRARKLGLTGSHFRNSTGLPDPEQHVTARDLAKLSEHIIRTYPRYYRIFDDEDFTWGGITQRNRNPLVAMDIGADGLKTGHTEDSGYGLVGSAVRDGQRLIVVLNGMDSAEQRAEEARKLLDWGFRAFERVKLFGGADVIGEARVFGGETMTVQLVGQKAIEMLLPRGNSDLIRGTIVYQGPVPAPVEAGQEIGALHVKLGDQTIREAPVYALDDVPVGSLPRRAFDGLQEMMLGWW